jgi:dephospho-CoA kinase
VHRFSLQPDAIAQIYNVIIIGITGTLGAGKGTVVDYLMEEHQFAHYSVRSFLTKEIEKRGMPVNRDSMVVIANELRAANSPSFIVEELYKEAEASGKNCIIESIRTPGEIDALEQKGDFFLLAVDAEPKLRYERIKLRKSATDMISYEEFIENEKREMNANDPNKQNLSVCINRADFKLENNSSFQELHKKVEEVLNVISSKV